MRGASRTRLPVPPRSHRDGTRVAAPSVAMRQFFVQGLARTAGNGGVRTLTNPSGERKVQASDWPPSVMPGRAVVVVSDSHTRLGAAARGRTEHAHVRQRAGHRHAHQNRRTAGSSTDPDAQPRRHRAHRPDLHRRSAAGAHRVRFGAQRNVQFVRQTSAFHPMAVAWAPARRRWICAIPVPSACWCWSPWTGSRRVPRAAGVLHPRYASSWSTCSDLRALLAQAGELHGPVV